MLTIVLTMMTTTSRTWSKRTVLKTMMLGSERSSWAKTWTSTITGNRFATVCDVRCVLLLLFFSIAATLPSPAPSLSLPQLWGHRCLCLISARTFFLHHFATQVPSCLSAQTLSPFSAQTPTILQCRSSQLQRPLMLGETA